MDFLVASIDGYGDRDDIALARDKQQGTIRENVRRDQSLEIPDQPFAESAEEGIAVSEIVKRLVRQGRGKALYYNHQIFWAEAARGDGELVENV